MLTTCHVLTANIWNRVGSMVRVMGLADASAIALIGSIDIEFGEEGMSLSGLGTRQRNKGKFCV